MDRMLASVMKEWRLLTRDRAGLLMLFLMPSLLVIVVSVVQMNVLKTMGDDPVAMLWVDRDQGDIARMLRDGLETAAGVIPVDQWQGRPLDEATALERVSEGDYQVCLVIPPGFSQAVVARSEAAATAMLAGPEPPPADNAVLPEIEVHFDPLAGGAFRSAVSQALQRLLAGIETRLKLAAFAERLPEHVAAALTEIMGPYASDGIRDKLSEKPLEWDARPLMILTEHSARRGGVAQIPSAVQQNVPAWGLFGIFFIAVPLSGAIVRERSSGIMTRLQLLPVSFMTLLTGKLLAYVVVCLAQFALVMLIGRFVMPLFGAAPLTLGQAPGAVAVVLLCVALAATGFGILLGVVTRTYEQASMIGAISVVIAAAIGGVMVPVFAMPRIMRDISQVSPMAWGLDAFLDLFARGGSFATVWLQAAMLLCFGLGMLLTAWMVFARQRR
jgi:ABC-2 type transport system permease protein